MRAIMQRLLDGVLFKRGAVFGGGRQLLVARQQFDLDSRAVRRHAELAQLARIPGGAVKPDQAPMISRCMITNSEMPARARSIIRAIWASSNGVCSAVACTSTNWPAPVITTFIST